MDRIDAERYMYNFIKNKQSGLSISDFEQWVYTNEELEDIFGETEYYELITRNYKDKFAYHETEKQIQRLAHFGLFEQERIIRILNELLTDEDATRQLDRLYILYEEYCSGYNFLRYIALSYITTSDDYKEALKENHSKFQSYIAGKRKEATRLLTFLENNQLRIDEEYVYSDFRDEKDRIEFHSINEMLNAR
ncbi:hypothetical protein R70723_19930 [Paenibacillus sp. FSL R7-0273]|uniref:hypothetical protein n=1 Tax=Paenibacillus sp. FSL R7-0273 TaxID=1536772 RepID=UPI0004F622C2|nr:hypothetical protein [Paenibacillus sp. FSL R7-0273]AIQ47920.1 hypothetical protein R70723_19930 [Paenibacillus sp. FSL R7-0273]OMF94531.1 hypothetical protein BK144_08365 [Paenibacillus sp. FSL R7-0273]